MGAAARATQRTVLHTAREAVERTNSAIDQYNSVIVSVRQIGEKTDELEAHQVTQGQQLASEATRIDRMDSLRKMAQTETSRCLSDINDRLDRVGQELTDAAFALTALEATVNRSFFGRCWWLVSGR